MGIIRQGIFGGFSNKTGPLIGQIRGNTNIIRSLPLKSAKPPTKAQEIQRRNFGEISSFLSHIKPLIDKGYFKPKNPFSALNRAIRANLKWAVVSSEGINRVDYTKISFSQGLLLLPAGIQAKAESGQTVGFSWHYQSHEEKWQPAEDRCTLLIYNKVKQTISYQIDVVPRAQSQYKFILPASFAGDLVYAYLSFNSVHHQNRCSNSYFIGRLTII